MGDATLGSEQKIRFVLDQAPVMAWTTDLEGRCSFVNRAWLDFTGRTLADELGEGWVENLDPDDRERAASSFQDAVQARRPFGMEYRIRRHDGRTRIVLDFGVPSHSEEGAFTGYLGFVVDISEMREAERGALRERRLYERFLDGICAHIAVLSQDGTIVFVNQTWRSFAQECGLTLRDAGLGANYLAVCDEAQGSDAEHAPQIAEAIRAVIAGRLPFFELEYPCHEPGKPRWFLVRVTPVGDGHEAAAVVQHVDVTALRQAEHHRLRLESKMQESQRLESLGTLAGGVAHDFNNLLTVILGNTQLTLEDLDAHAPAPLRRKLERIQTAAETAARLTDQMLTYAGKGTVELSPQDLSALVAEMRELLQVSQGGRGTLELRLADDLPPIQADPKQMQQVILNLVTNAFEALESSAGSVRVGTSTLEADADSLADCFGVADPALGRYVSLEVCDTGAGVDPSQRVRLFEPFFTTKFSGRGLGLPSVLGIVRAHGGVIQVDETPGGGTTFRILLPAAEQGAHPRAGNPGPEATAGRARTILVVDDEESVLDVAEAFLQRAGFEVITARGGQKGLEVLRARSDEIGAVLLDLAMPELNGEETFAAMRRLRPDLPVVLVSGFSEEMAAERFPHEGLAGFLHKPYRPDALVAKVRAALTRPEERD